ncbi:MAG: hypothetical protein IKQ31_02695 [Clostridia bacterium]|nr:hypothetical protein [Clostridia bacterium]
MISLLCSFVDDIVNHVREIPTSTRIIIEVFILVLLVSCIAFAINLGKNHAEKPIKWIFIVFAGILGLLLVLIPIIT